MPDRRSDLHATIPSQKCKEREQGEDDLLYVYHQVMCVVKPSVTCIGVVRRLDVEVALMYSKVRDILTSSYDSHKI